MMINHLKPTLLTFFTAALLVLPLSVSAVPLNEAETLKRVLMELDAMNPLIAEAQRVSDHQARLRFDFRCLIGDVNLLKHGLRAAIYEVRHKGVNQSLCGDYGHSGQLGSQARYLHLVVHELQSLSPIIQDAKGLSDKSLRARLNYSSLQGDIDTIISAIQYALIGAGEQARSIPVLRGGFSQ